MAASLRSRVRAGALVALLAACSVGHGSGELSGTLRIEGCRPEGQFVLAPDTFFAQAAQELLMIRVQRGGDLEVYSDGIAVLVEDASLVKQDFLGAEIDLAGDREPVVRVTAYFNDTCPAGRDRVPVLLRAVSGTIRFESIYAPRVNRGQVRIRALLQDVRFEDAQDPEARWAQLSGDFDFLYVRGSPAQHFP